MSERVQPQPRPSRGAPLLAAHCRSLDLEAPRARERLEAAVGPELATKLVRELSRRAAGAKTQAAPS